MWKNVFINVRNLEKTTTEWSQSMKLFQNQLITEFICLSPTDISKHLIFKSDVTMKCSYLTKCLKMSCNSFLNLYNKRHLCNHFWQISRMLVHVWPKGLENPQEPRDDKYSLFIINALNEWTKHYKYALCLLGNLSLIHVQVVLSTCDKCLTRGSYM